MKKILILMLLLIVFTTVACTSKKEQAEMDAQKYIMAYNDGDYSVLCDYSNRIVSNNPEKKDACINIANKYLETTRQGVRMVYDRIIFSDENTGYLYIYIQSKEYENIKKTMVYKMTYDKDKWYFSYKE